ncbi:MAG TPA: SRPBCC family protein [Pseudolabrys sp.]
MSKPSFVYVTYIRSSADKVWAALTSPEYTAKTWFGIHHETDWKAGAPWRLVLPDGRVTDSGEIVEIDKPRRLVLKWRNEFKAELKAEGWSRCTIEIEPVTGDAVKLTVTHRLEGEGTKFIGAVSGGWPHILSNVKSLLETGELVLKEKVS